MRAELEKSEALRQSIEYETSVAKNTLNKERSINMEKEKYSEEMIKSLEGNFFWNLNADNCFKACLLACIEKFNVVVNENSQIKEKLQTIDGQYSSELLKIKKSLEEKVKIFWIII